MAGIALLLGAAFGVAFRVTVFLLAVFSILALAVIGSAVGFVADGQLMWTMVVTAVSLQVGYVGGIGLRAGWSRIQSAEKKPLRPHQQVPARKAEHRYRNGH